MIRLGLLLETQGLERFDKRAAIIIIHTIAIILILIVIMNGKTVFTLLGSLPFPFISLLPPCPCPLTILVTIERKIDRGVLANVRVALLHFPSKGENVRECESVPHYFPSHGALSSLRASDGDQCGHRVYCDRRCESVKPPRGRDVSLYGGPGGVIPTLLLCCCCTEF